MNSLTSEAMAPIEVGVIGVGYWGPNLVRVLGELGATVHVHDCDSARIQAVCNRFTSCIPEPEVTSMLANPSIEAIVLSVPMQNHHELGVRCLKAGKHLFIEKPLCGTTHEADDLASHKNGNVLMVGHITAFSAGVRELARRVQGGDVGEVRHLSFRRTHLGPVYHATDVLTEVAAHDVAILLSLVDELPARVNAWGVERLGLGHPDRAILLFSYDNGLVCKVEVAWSSAVRRRRILVEGSGGTLVFEADGGAESLTRFDESHSLDCLRQGLPQVEVNAALRVESVPLEKSEPLKLELNEFLSAIREGREPSTGLTFGRKVVAVLSAARSSMFSSGATVEVGE